MRSRWPKLTPSLNKNTVAGLLRSYGVERVFEVARIYGSPTGTSVNSSTRARASKFFK